jgi:transposase
MSFAWTYPRETQEMVFDAHVKVFAFFGGACARRNRQKPTVLPSWLRERTYHSL